MKLLNVFSLFAIASSAYAEEGSLRKSKRELAGGSVDTPIGGGSASICFSEIASVQVFGKGAVPMKDLQVGDRIFTGETYQPVYAFAHRDPTHKAAFVQIHTAEATLEATGSHLLFLDGKQAPVRADRIQVGDVLQGNAVTKIGGVHRSGVYAPLTANGQLVVDGVKASNYVSLEQADRHALLGQNVHAFSHLGVSPFRFACNQISSRICQDYNQEGIPSFLVAIHGAFDWFMELPVVFQAVAIAIYLVLAAMTWTLECIFANPCFVFGVLSVLAATKATGVRVQATKVKTV